MLNSSLSSITISVKEIEDLLRSGTVDKAELINITVNIARVFRLKEMSDLAKPGNDSKKQKIIDEVKKQTDSTNAAIFVYEYFYRSVQQIFPRELEDALAEA